MAGGSKTLDSSGPCERNDDRGIQMSFYATDYGKLISQRKVTDSRGIRASWLTMNGAENEDILHTGLTVCCSGLRLTALHFILLYAMCAAMRDKLPH